MNFEDTRINNVDRWNELWSTVPNEWDDSFGTAFHEWYAHTVITGKMRECTTDSEWRNAWVAYLNTATIMVEHECEECGEDGHYPVYSGEWSNQLECAYCDNTVFVNRTM